MTSKDSRNSLVAATVSSSMIFVVSPYKRKRSVATLDRPYSMEWQARVAS